MKYPLYIVVGLVVLVLFVLRLLFTIWDIITFKEKDHDNEALRQAELSEMVRKELLDKLNKK